MQKRENVQDVFLAAARRGRVPVTVFLAGGFQLRGQVSGFDSFTVVLLSEGKQNLIYKHAISTIIPERALPTREESAGEQGSLP